MNAGLMEQGAAAEAPPVQPEPQSTGEENVTPQEQEAYDGVMNAALETLYSDKSHKKILETLKQGDPAEALATTAASIITEIDAQSGGKIPETVIIPAAIEILELLAESAGVSGTISVDESTIQQAGQQLMLALIQQYGADPEEVQSLVGEFDQTQLDQMVAEQQKIAEPWANEPAVEQGAPAAPQEAPAAPQEAAPVGGMMQKPGV